jgi:hypothetical protein
LPREILILKEKIQRDIKYKMRVRFIACNPGLGFIVNSRNYLYLTDFLNGTFLHENAQNRAFYGGEYSSAGAIYFNGIYHDAARSAISAIFTHSPSSVALTSCYGVTPSSLSIHSISTLMASSISAKRSLACP